jgi:spore coat polysaccharide biosynthesis protein SpsF
VVQSILEHLYQKTNPLFSIDDVKAFLDSHPEIYKINSHIIRNEGLLKSLQNDGNVFV